MLKMLFIDDPGSMKRVRETVMRLWSQDRAGELGETSLLAPPFGEQRSLDAIFSEWIGRILKEPCGSDDTILFLIHANAQITAGAWLQECEGTEFLKHLRLTSPSQDASDQTKRDWCRVRCAHAIVYSFESLENILRRRPGDLILTTTGVTFMRMPDLLCHNALERIVARLKDPEQKDKMRADVKSEAFRAAIRADYSPPDSAHALANWWGVKRLIEGAKVFHHPGSAADQSDIPKPHTIEENLEHLSNKKAIFFADHVWKPTEKRVSDDEKKRIAELKSRLTNPAVKTPLIVYVDDQLQDGWHDAVRYALSGKVKDDKWLKAIDPASIEVSETCLQNRTPRCVARRREILRLHLTVIEILGAKPQMVITDLRLRGESEAKDSFATASGARLIRLLRRLQPALPILLITASNRADSVQQAQYVGADAYWTKEGIGERSMADTQERHSADFVLLTERLLDDDYNLLRILDAYRCEVKERWHFPLFTGATCCCPPFLGAAPGQRYAPWWKSHDWPPLPPTHPESGKKANAKELTHTEANKSQVLKILRNVMVMYRAYLRTLTMLDNAPEDMESFWVRGLCVHIGRLVEAVHRFDSLEDNQSREQSLERYARSRTIGAKEQWSRKDWLGAAIYHVRNHAAHLRRDATFRHGRVQLVLRTLLQWLRVCTPEWGATFAEHDAFLNLMERVLTKKETLSQIKDEIDKKVGLRHGCIEKNLEKSFGA